MWVKVGFRAMGETSYVPWVTNILVNFLFSYHCNSSVGGFTQVRLVQLEWNIFSAYV
jgi:hypothetical protein